MSNNKNNFKSLEVIVSYGNLWKKVVISNLINSPSGLLVKTCRVSFPRGEDLSGKAFKPVVQVTSVKGKTIELTTGTTAAYLPNGLSCIFTVKSTRAQWHGEVCILVEVAIGEDIEVNERLELLQEFATIKDDIKSVFAEDTLKAKIDKLNAKILPFNRA
jgi:hypothetical protein